MSSLNRRECIKYIALLIAANPIESLARSYIKAENLKRFPGEIIIQPLEQKTVRPKKVVTPTIVMGDRDIKDYLSKVRHPNNPHPDDIILDAKGRQLLSQVVKRFQRVRSYIGHGHFCALGYDESLAISKRVSKIGRFTTEEQKFLEMLFYRDASKYGFMGEKQILHLTHRINKRDIYKVPYSGNYLYKGESLEKFELIQRELGRNLILTSGIRGLTKQFYLFLSKANRFKGNLSLASRSLAPPGYSYHATGDFDVGQRGLGGDNFSTEFVNTEIYHELTSKGYVRYRYDKDNLLGVRYEPWHVKV